MPPADIISLETRRELITSGMFLATEIALGRYGASACGIVVPDPFNKPTFWVDGRGTSSGKAQREITPDMQSMYGSDPIELARHYNICPRFMLLRTITAPDAFLEQLSSDSDLGPALIKKAVYTNSGINKKVFVETNFHHSPEIRNLQTLFHDYDEDEGDFLDQLEKLNAELIGSINGTNGLANIILEQVPSWHATTEQSMVTRELEHVNKQVIANLDDIAEKILGLQPIKMIGEEPVTKGIAVGTEGKEKPSLPPAN